VRDVAELHLRAMTDAAPRANASWRSAGDFMLMVDIAKVLKARMGASAEKCRPAIAQLAAAPRALRDPAVKQLLPELGKFRTPPNEKASACWLGAAFE